MSSRITTILVVLGFLAVGFLTFSSVFLRGLRPPTESGALVTPSVAGKVGE